MKKIFLLLVSTIAFAQNEKESYMSFSGAVDVRNLAVGSDPTGNKSALNYLLNFGMVSKNMEINVGYERFSVINFSKNSIGFGYHILLFDEVAGYDIKAVIIPSLEPTIINRWGNWGGGISHEQKSSHLSVGANLGVRLHFSRAIALEYLFNALPRTDLKGMYGSNNSHRRRSINGIPLVGSNYFKIVYKIPR